MDIFLFPFHSLIIPVQGSCAFSCPRMTGTAKESAFRGEPEGTSTKEDREGSGAVESIEVADCDYSPQSFTCAHHVSSQTKKAKAVHLFNLLRGINL